ncbi:helix-turn-helix transcriptional regulator [Pseudomonas citronellolis]|uniref:Helix-turn-helix transcriptional regulator n=1 Tax=Pseudomonas citronellolis TaxID=53408 RepID=A0AAW6PGH3_9PSED|nr:helix-turn-helix transcriptional regulator [Pseudomonas citronellolis]MDF3845321.1 helix-turn-helix transcriptional regulator [Pseudomonas citronellolis]
MYQLRASTFFNTGTPQAGPPGCHVHTQVLQPGLEVSLVSFEATHNESISTIDDSSHLHFSCMLNGDVGIRIGHKSLYLGKGQLMTSFAPAERFELEFAPAHRNLELRITPQRLSELAGDDYHRLGDSIERSFCLQVTHGNQRIKDAALRLERLLSDEPSSPLLVHSATLEFLAWHLKAFAPQDQEGQICKREQRLLLAARERLLMDLSAPPTIEQLAREVGLNQLKLKRGFKALFDTSIYALFQRERMGKARQLLRQHGVTDTASMLGYSNISHFSTAFRKQYGVLPRDVRKGALE